MTRILTYLIDVIALVVGVVMLIALAALDEPVELETWTDS